MIGFDYLLFPTFVAATFCFCCFTVSELRSAYDNAKIIKKQDSKDTQKYCFKEAYMHFFFAIVFLCLSGYAAYSAYRLSSVIF